jgi:hypothetical protein
MILAIAAFCIITGVLLWVPQKPIRKNVNRFREPKNE